MRTHAPKSHALKEVEFEMYAVYARGKTALGVPLFWVNATEKREMIRNGSAIGADNGKAVRLLLNLEQFRGQSATMGYKVTQKAAEGCKFNRAIADMWMTPGYNCPLIPVAAAI